MFTDWRLDPVWPRGTASGAFVETGRPATCVAEASWVNAKKRTESKEIKMKSTWSTSLLAPKRVDSVSAPPQSARSPGACSPENSALLFFGDAAN